jgi:hypothetical protein
MILMPLQDLFTPEDAEKIATFGGSSAGRTAQLNYDVALPGAHSWGRIVPLELDPATFVDLASQQGTSLTALGIVSNDGEDQGKATIDSGRLASFYRETIPTTSRPSLRLVAEVGGDVAPLLAQRGEDGIRAEGLATESVEQGLLARRATVNEPDDVVIQRQRIDSYIDALAVKHGGATLGQLGGKLLIPAPGLGHSIHPVPVNPVAPPQPRIALVETWELRSYLGDYGLGRTIQTFSLLPGERTTITFSTWRTEAATRDDSSSIFDSSDTAAQSRFSNSLADSSGSASQDQGGWSTSVSTSASAGASFFGLVSGSASISAGFAANHQEASQRYSNTVSQAASEHASQVNNSRRQSVESSSSSSTESGSATTTVREISNTNLRRVLNFVFRELNQTYETYVVLRDIRIAFYNGQPGSVEIVPLPDLGTLLRKYVDTNSQTKVAKQVLGLCAQRFDANADLVTLLDVGTNPTGVTYTWKPAKLGSDGTIDFNGDPLSSDVRWRIRPGALSKPVAGRTIDGIVMTKSSVVLRTDNIVVEALLGQADALDPYASALQALDLLRRQAENEATQAETRRVTDALAIVDGTPDNKKVDAWGKIFPDNPDIEVLQAAASTVSDGGNHH